MRALIILGVVALSGCSWIGGFFPDDLASSSASGQKLICVRERKTGSILKEVHCRTPEQMAKEEQEARTLLGQVKDENAVLRPR